MTSIKTVLAGFALVAVVCLAVVLLADSTPTQRTPSTRSSPAETTPSGPRLTEKQINRQDRTSKRQARREARAFDQRPLLNALPTNYQGVSVDIGGLAADGRRTVVTVDAHGQGRRWALVAYRALRRETGDRSDDYELEIRP